MRRWQRCVVLVCCTDLVEVKRTHRKSAEVCVRMGPRYCVEKGEATGKNFSFFSRSHFLRTVFFFCVCVKKNPVYSYKL